MNKIIYAASGVIIGIIIASIWEPANFFSGSEEKGQPENQKALSGAANNALKNLSKSARASTQEMHQLADITERASDAVVNISSMKIVRRDPSLSPFHSDPFFRFFFGDPGRGGGGVPREERQSSLGSGVVVSEDGYIITNNHVIEGADEINVNFGGERKNYQAKVIGKDPNSDLAILKIEAKGLKTLPFGDSSQLRLADLVLAIGNPFGVGKTVTMGIVSALGRANMGIVDYEDFIQTDAAINPGNSGGALINTKGELIGVNTAIISRTGGYQGIGFAIPSNMVKQVFESIITHGRIVRGFLGVVIQDLTEDMAKSFNLNTPEGVLVSHVEEDSPAEKAGIKLGDIILSMNGEKMNSASHLRNRIAHSGKDTKAEFKILREGKTLTITATLVERVRGEAVASAEAKKEEGLLGGVTVNNVNEALQKRYELPRKLTKGVVITNIEQGSSAHRAGLKEGDVILEINRKRVANVQEFRKLSSDKNNNMLLLIWRQGYSMYIMLRK